MPFTTIDDFEDGDVSEWSGDTGNFSAVSSGALSGTYSGELTSTNSNPEVSTSFSTTSDPVVRFLVEIDNKSGSESFFDGVLFRIGGTDYPSSLAEVRFADDGDIRLNNDDSPVTWSTNTTYDVEFRLDFDSEIVELYIDDSQVNSEPFIESNDEYGTVAITNERDDTGDTTNALVDDIEIGTYTTVSTAPQNVNSDADSADAVTTTWDEPSDWGGDEGGYRVYRSTTDSPSFPGDYTEVADVGTGTESYQDTGLTDGTEFTFAVTAYNTAGESDPGTDTATTPVPAPALDAVEQTASDTLTPSWTKEDGNTTGSYEIYRSESSGSVGSLVATVSDLGTTTTDDTGLSQTETEYYYTVRRVTDDTSADSAQLSNVLVTAPSDLTIEAINGDQFDLSWADNSSYEDGYRAQVKPTSSGAWSDDGDEPPDATTYTTTALLDGEEYDIRVGAINDSHVEYSGTETATTELPDAQEPTLGNGVEDEISVEWDDVIDYGEYGIQYRETGANTWIDEPSESEGTTETQITGLEDGEEYEVRMRTQTEHVTGDWTTPVSIVTKFPGATDLLIRLASYGNLVAVWDDNSDNEDGFRLMASDDGGSTFEEIADVGTGTTRAAVDISPSETTDFEFKARAYTEHTSADSSTVAETVYQTRAVLNWPDLPDFSQAGFRVLESDDGGNSFEEIADLDADVFRYETRDLVPNPSDTTDYKYRIEAYD